MYLQVFEIGSADDLVALDWFTEMRQSTWGSSEAAETVAQIVKEVAGEGDRAVVRYMQKWTDPEFDSNKIRVSSELMVQSLRELNTSLRDAIKSSINNVQTYQQHIRPADIDPILVGDAQVGLRYTPVPSVGLLVPGGKAAYPSTVIMLAVPAMVAGVKPEQISVITPPPTRAKPNDEPGDVSKVVLAVCALLGISRVYRIGGAQGVAALALGTKSVDRVDMIVGPGNVYTQLAKQQLAGRVGIDGFYGPSEILTIADNTANPALVAMDSTLR